MYNSYEGCIDPGQFQPRNGHEFIEMTVRHGNAPHTEFIEEFIEEKKISAWLQGTEVNKHVKLREGENQRTSTFRLLICAPRRDPGLSLEPFPFSLSTYSDVVKIFRIPEAFLTFVATHTSIATDFQADTHVFGMLANLSSHGLAFSYDSQTRTTNCFVVGLCAHQIARCKQELRALRAFAGDPTLFASIWLDVFTETRARRAEGRRIGILEIQLESGLHWSCDATKFSSMALDFDILTHKLTALWSELGWDEFALKILADFRDKLVLMRARDIYPGENEILLGVDKVGDKLDKRLRNTNDLLHGLRAGTTHIAQLASIQLQTIYSLINQRDSRLNVEQAEASRQLAELSFHNSEAMRSIAIDSRKVALLTRRDSTDMRMIAAVTLAFLPGTFTATLFSTSFFNFGPTDNRQVVSSWIWLYWVIAVALTVIVMVGWYRFSRRADQELHTTFNPTLPGAESLPHVPPRANGSGIQQRQAPALANENFVLKASSQAPIPFDSNESQVHHAHNRKFSAAAAPRQTTFDKRNLEEPLKPIRPMPSSKITNMGMRDSKDTCPCCARPLA